MPHFNSKPASNPTENWNLIALRSYNTRHKSWNTCVRFPFPNVDLCIAVIWVRQNTRGLTLGKERGTFQREQRCQEQMSEIFQKIQVKRCLFQRFVTSIERRSVTSRYHGSTISDDNKPTTTAKARRTAKNNMFILTNNDWTTLHVHHAILYIPLQSLHHYDMKLPNFKSPLYGVGEYNTKMFAFFFLT